MPRPRSCRYRLQAKRRADIVKRDSSGILHQASGGFICMRTSEANQGNKLRRFINPGGVWSVRCDTEDAQRHQNSLVTSTQSLTVELSPTRLGAAPRRAAT